MSSEVTRWLVGVASGVVVLAIAWMAAAVVVQGQEVSALKARATSQDDRLRRIEFKLDRLLDRRLGDGNGPR